ncbi:MAG: HAD-IC family P-type ATPase [bacterium]
MTNPHSLTIEETIKKLSTSRRGLTKEEADFRYNKYGKNILPAGKKFSRVKIFFSQFKSVLVYVLLAAAIISFFLGETTDMSVILAAVILNVVIGYFQEAKAETALEKLRESVKQYSIVVRDEKEGEILSENLVMGDLLIFHAGDKVPADCRIVNQNDLQVNEAALTGESYPIKKNTTPLPEGAVLADRKNMLFTGTVVISGRAEAIVCSTGVDTEMGKIAMLIKDTVDERTPLQNKLDKFSKFLGIVILFITFLLFLAGVLLGKDAKEMFLVAVAVAVSAIPEGFLVAVTAILAVGMERILRKKALVRKLVAAETLGSTTYICTDKTGTLTIGDMRVSKIITYNHDLDEIKISPDLKNNNNSPLKLLKIGMLSSDAHIENPDDEAGDWIIFGTPTEKALLLAGIQIGLKQNDLKKEYPRLDEIPFSSEAKFMITLHKFNDKENHLYIKGAPERILKMCSRIDLDDRIENFDETKRRKIKQQFEKLSEQGLRILALGYKDIDLNIKKIKDIKNINDDYVFVGFVGIKDPLRPEASETIKICKEAGITPVMISGDHKLTAKAIARELGMPSGSENILTGEELEKIDDRGLQKIVKNISVYARVTPSDKIRIVRALKASGEVVAMTGDGINDAPAIKAADIGVALGSGTDVAKETADIVLLDNNFKTIVDAVEQGRIIYDNIKKVLLYLLSNSFTEIILIILAIMSGAPLPILASQILWINLVDDSLPSLALTFEPGDPNILNDNPQNHKKQILDFERKFLIFFISVITGLANFFLFLWMLQCKETIMEVRTIVFADIGINSLFYIFSCRSLKHSIWNKEFFVNKYLIGAVLAGIFLQVIAIYLPFFQKFLQTVPLHFFDWVIIIALNIGIVLSIEIAKFVFMRRRAGTLKHENTKTRKQ